MMNIHGGNEDVCSILADVSDDRVTTNDETELDEQIEITIEEEPDDDHEMMTVAEPSFEATSDTNTLHHFSEHNYFAKKHKVPVMHKCDDCGYETNRKNTLINHQAETCQVRRQKGLLAVKDKQCKYCLKKITHNDLRSDLRHFIKVLKANRKPKGKHSSISQQEFIDYLNEIKLKK